MIESHYCGIAETSTRYSHTRRVVRRRVAPYAYTGTRIVITQRRRRVACSLTSSCALPRRRPNRVPHDGATRNGVATLSSGDAGRSRWNKVGLRRRRRRRRRVGAYKHVTQQRLLPWSLFSVELSVTGVYILLSTVAFAISLGSLGKSVRASAYTHAFRGSCRFPPYSFSSLSLPFPFSVIHTFSYFPPLSLSIFLNITFLFFDCSYLLWDLRSSFRNNSSRRIISRLHTQSFVKDGERRFRHDSPKNLVEKTTGIRRMRACAASCIARGCVYMIAMCRCSGAYVCVISCRYETRLRPPFIVALF